MSPALADNLDRDSLRQLLAAIGSKPAQDSTEIEAVDFDWRQPRYFTEAELQELNHFTLQIGSAIAEKFSYFNQSKFDVNVTSTTVHFWGECAGTLCADEQEDYYLAFGRDHEHLCGFIGISHQTVAAWLTFLLGDSETDKETGGTELSKLEESLLYDLICSIIKAISDSMKGQHDLQPAKSFKKAQLPVQLPGTEEVLKCNFTIKQTDTEKTSDAYMIIPCYILAPIVGKTIEKQKPTEDNKKAILSCLQDIPVSVKVLLVRIMLTLEELMSLRPCDILLLNKPINEPLELIIDEQPLFLCSVAKSDGQQAVVVTHGLSFDCENAQAKQVSHKKMQNVDQVITP